MSPEVQKAVAECNPGFIATASKAGKPNVSAKGSLQVLDDEHLLFADVRSPGTIANLKENSQIAIFCFDPATRSGCRISGRAELFDNGPLYDKLSEAFAARNMQVKHAVKIAVDDSSAFKM